MVPRSTTATTTTTTTTRCTTNKSILLLIGVAVLFVVVFNFRLARTVGVNDDDEHHRLHLHPENIESSISKRRQQQQQRYPPLLPSTTTGTTISYPIFVVGLPKVGTTSIHEMFQCSGIKSSHYCCCGSNRTHTHCNDIPNGKLMAVCMQENYKQNRSILDGCGSYNVYAQMDAEFGNSMFLPQRFQMEEIHNYAPNATFLLNLRPAKDWVKSVTNWYGLGGRFLIRFQFDYRKLTDRHQVLEDIYNNHTTYIRNFVKHHPSHQLIEINITNNNTGSILATTFGLNSSCWGIYNKNKKRDTNKKKKKNHWKMIKH